MASSGPLDSVTSCGRTAGAGGPKSLAFSIDRIMSKSAEPRPAEDGRPLLGLCAPIPCMIPLPPLGYELHSCRLMNYSELWRASVRGALCGKTNCSACVKPDSSLKQPLLSSSRVVKPQVLHQAVAVPGSLYYVNYLESAYPQHTELLAGPWSQASLAAHQRLLLRDSAKLSSDKLPTPQYPHKEHLPGQLDQIVKDHSLSVDKSTTKTHSKVNSSSADGKPKNFTCEVCGKVFNAHYNLTRHMPVHTGARPSCAKCVGRASVRPVLCADTRSSTRRRNLTNVTSAEKPSTGALRSTRTCASTQDTSPSSASSAGKASTKKATTRTTS
ncbi:hypothetical protein WMY93_004379 [Mugilogobius chulae]|uniref:C2H2-type domain-containing protein n=1 Tax=Mugilogobius chulae TaxID=88201 RepID=A0AAW0PS47_9GOBI